MSASILRGDGSSHKGAGAHFLGAWEETEQTNGPLRSLFQLEASPAIPAGRHHSLQPPPPKSVTVTPCLSISLLSHTGCSGPLSAFSALPWHRKVSFCSFPQSIPTGASGLGERRGFSPETTPCPGAAFSAGTLPSPSPCSPECLLAEETEGLALLLAVEALGGAELCSVRVCPSHREGLPVVL